MSRSFVNRTRLALTVALAWGVLPAAGWCADLSSYRNFQLGSSKATVLRQAGTDESQLKVLHRRPALIQELEWWPRSSGAQAATESAKEVVFTFYNGELSRIQISYDRYDTEGLTSDDIVESISATYGQPTKPMVANSKRSERYGDVETVIALWQDAQFRIELVRYSYGPAFKMNCVLKRLESAVETATTEAARLDITEAPQREADRVAKDAETEKTKREKARVVNKPKFRP